MSVHICANVVVHMCTSTPVHVHMEADDNLGYCPPGIVYLDLHTWSLTGTWGSVIDKTQWIRTESTCILLHRAGIAGICHHAWLFHMDAGDRTQDPTFVPPPQPISLSVCTTLDVPYTLVERGKIILDANTPGLLIWRSLEEKTHLVLDFWSLVWCSESAGNYEQWQWGTNMHKFSPLRSV